MEQLLKFVRIKPIWVLLVTLVAVMAAGLSGLAYPSTYSPLYFLGLILITVVFIIWLWKPAWALYTAIVIVFLPAGLIPASLQSNLNRSIVIVAFVIWLFDIIIQRRKLLFSSTAILMLMFITWSLLTFFWVKNLDAAKIILQVYIMRFLLFVFLIPNQIRTLKNLNGLFFTLTVSGWVFLLFSIASLIQQGYTPGMRFKAYDVNENEAGLLTLVMMLGVLWMASQPSRHYQTLRVIAAFAFMAISMGFVAISGSRGSAISLFITLLVFLLWRSSRLWGKFGFLLLFLAVIMFPMLFTTTLERFTSMTDGLLGSREVLWAAAGQVISKHPIVGVGIGGSPYAILPYLAVPPSSGGIDGTSIHNPVLVIWSETGVFGLVLYLGILLSAMGSFVNQYLYYRKLDISQTLIPYFALVSSVFLGYMASWIKGGGMQTGYIYFLLISLLLIPASLDPREVIR